MGADFETVPGGPLAGAELDPRLTAWHRAMAMIAGAILVALGFRGIFGGWADFAPPAFGPADTNRLAPEIAAAFVLLGAALVVIARRAAVRRRAADLVAATASVVGAVVALAGPVADAVRAASASPSIAAGDRAASWERGVVASVLALLGVALALLCGRPRARRLAFAQAVAALVGVVGLFHLFAWTLHVPPLGQSAARAPIAPEAAIGLLAAAIGLAVARADDGFGALLSARGPGGETLRRILPFVVLLPPAVIQLRILAVGAGLVGEARGITATAVVFAGVGVGLAVWTSHRLTVQDVARRRTERELRASERAFEAAQARVRMGSWELDPETGRARWSKQMARLFGRNEKAEAPSLEALCELVHAEDRALLVEAHAAVRTTGRSIQVLFRRAPAIGPLCWLEAGAEVTSDGAGRRLLGGSVLDVTQRVTSFEELRASEERSRRAEEELRQLIERSPVGICRATLEGRYLSANPAYARILGFDSEAELLSLDIPTALYRTPADRRVALDEFHRHGAEGIEIEMLRRDHRPVRVRVRGREVVERDGAVVLEAFVEDVTERRALALQLERAQRLESIGRLAAGIAHDFNNVAGVARGYAELVGARLGPGSDLRAWTGEIVEAIDRAADLTRQLLALGSQQVGRLEPLEPGVLLERLSGMLRRLIGDQVELELRVAPGAGRVLADRGQLEQVVVNLAVNARDAMPGGGRLVLAATDETVDAAHAASRPGLVEGRYVVIEATDEGCGMDAETLEHVFEPFFTTKPPGKGTGLGLATVYGVVRQCGGQVTVYSEPGVGTTFRIYLPRHDGLPESVSPHRPADSVSVRADAAADGGTVLVVEDEPALRNLFRLMLRGAGFEVLLASGPAAAREIATSRGAELRLLICDMQLGAGLLGTDLADELRRLRPALPVIFVSGYAEPAAIRERRSDGLEAFLAKPFSADALLRTVGRLLASESDPPEGRLTR